MEKPQTTKEMLADAREIYGAFDKAQRALGIVNNVLAREPDNVEALNLKATLLFDLDRDEEAEEFHRRALALEPNSVEALQGLAELENERLHFTDALKLIERAFNSLPNDPDPELRENEDARQRLLAGLYSDKAFALWYLDKHEEARHVLTIDGPLDCPLEIETFEDELDWLEQHPDSPEDLDE